MSTNIHTPAESTTTDRLAAFMAHAVDTEPPAGSDELASLHLLDTLASIVACRDLHAGRAARAYATNHSSGEVPILGTSDRVSLLDAAFASAIIAHGAEINDFCPSSFVQPGPGVVSTAMCIGVARNRSGADVLRAVIAGYEIACRLPVAIGNARLRAGGVANHSLGSLFGSATAAASLIGLDRDQAEHLVAYCAQQASGSWQWLLDIEHLEKSFVFGGMGVHNAVHAALLVEAGFTGVPDALDAPGGWLHGGLLAGSDDHELTRLTDGLGLEHHMHLVGFKQFPVGGPVQPIIQGALELANEPIESEVVSVVVEMPGAADTFANARMPALNARYLVALIVLDGELDFVAAQSLERFRGDDRVRDFMNRVELRHDPAQETDPRSESARVTFHHADGSTRTTYVDHVRGYPSHPMSRDEVVDKASQLLTRAFSPEHAGHVIDLTLGIADLDSVAPIVDAIGRP